MKIINVLFALIIAVGLFLPFNYPVQAATEDLAIASEGSNTTGTYAGGAGDYTNLNSAGNKVAYINISATHPTTSYHSWNMAHSAVGASTVSNLRITYEYWTASNLGMMSPYLLIGGTKYYGTEYDPQTVDVLTTSTYDWATNPSGGNWSISDINALEVGIRFRCTTPGYGSDVNVGYMKTTITYTLHTAPTVTTQAVTSITSTTATGNGNVTSDGGSVITERGTVIAVTANPTTADHKDTSAGTTGAFTTSITALTKGTLYHVRAYAINAINTSYGADESFTTINDPTISTAAASLVSSTTARLNSNVTFDGSVVTGEPCTVTFVYVEDGAGAPYANYAAVLAEGGSTQTAVAGTWIAGQLPYLDISGLTVLGDYSFAVKIINSTATTTYGSVLTFTTSSGISDASSLTAIPTATTVSLAWVKGLGAGYTLVRYSASAYPATTADGTLAYLGVGNSYMLTGLTPGTSYYFSAWGKTGALYSAGYVMAMATTLAFDTAVSTGTIEAPPSNSWWNQTPSTTKVSSIPLVSGLVSANATAYAIPEASLWYFLWVLFSVGIGVFIYSKSGNNLPMSLGAQALLFALGAVLGLVMLWIMVLFMVIGAGFSLWGDRR